MPCFSVESSYHPAFLVKLEERFPTSEKFEDSGTKMRVGRSWSGFRWGNCGENVSPASGWPAIRIDRSKVELTVANRDHGHPPRFSTDDSCRWFPVSGVCSSCRLFGRGDSRPETFHTSVLKGDFHVDPRLVGLSLPKAVRPFRLRPPPTNLAPILCRRHD